MSILTVLTVKPIILLGLQSVKRPIAGLARLLGAAAEIRGRAVATTYLMAMGINPNHDDERAGFRDY